MVCVAIVAAVAIPTAAMAAVGTFTSATATPAVTGTNSSTAVNAKGVQGTATAGGASSVYGVAGSANASTNGVGVNGSGKKWGVLGVSGGTALNAAGLWGNATATSAVDHFGVWGNANGTGGIGVKGIGAKYGVYSSGPLGVAAGKPLSCTGCVGAGALAADARQIAPLASGQSQSGFLGGSDSYPPTQPGDVATTFSLVRPVPGALSYAVAGPHCPGPGLADPGYFCTYDISLTDASYGGVYPYYTASGLVGGTFYWPELGGGLADVLVSYTVTAL